MISAYMSIKEAEPEVSYPQSELLGIPAGSERAQIYGLGDLYRPSVSSAKLWSFVIVRALFEKDIIPYTDAMPR